MTRVNATAGAVVPLLVGLFSVASEPTSAQGKVLYSNGPTNGNISASNISAVGTQALSESFTLSYASIIRGIRFGGWSNIGDRIVSVDWHITSNQYDYTFGTQTDLSGVPLGGGGGYYSVREDRFPTGAISLPAGTYYLVLQGAQTAKGTNGAWWDLNYGPSVATAAVPGGSVLSASQVATVPSHAFDILGSARVPEPTTWVMLISGMGMVGAVQRSRRPKGGSA